MHNRNIKDTSQQRVWAFMGDGEMAEPESLGAIRVAAREELDNLTWVINCNLQQLDGPVTGNGKIIQELEANFRGAGWNVIKVIWGREWDALLAKDVDGVLVNRMNTTPDGQFQTYSTEDGGFVRDDFFGIDPRLRKMVEHMSDSQIEKLPRGGHDYRKVYAAFDAATKHVGQPTVILAHTIKGWTIDALEGKNATHQMKKLTPADLKKFRDRLYLPISDRDLEESYEKTGGAPFFHPGEDSPEIEYMMERRKQLGGVGAAPRAAGRARSSSRATRSTPSSSRARARTRSPPRWPSSGSCEDWMKNPEIGDRIVPIAPDEYRTFGMDSMFPSAKVYNPGGQQYDPVDRKLLLSYKESAQGQMLHEGISEAGAMASATAAGSAYSTHGEHMIPFYIFYSMFGFQRTGDSIWAMADQLARGFLIGATAGRTTLTGEGLQHADGHSPAHRGDQPGGRALRPGVRLRGQPHHAVGPRADVRRRRGERDLLHHRLQRAGQPAGRAGGRRRRGHPQGHPQGQHRRGRGPAGPAARVRGRLPLDQRRRHDARRGLGRHGRHLVGHLVERAGPRRRRGRGAGTSCTPASPSAPPFVTDKLAGRDGPVRRGVRLHVGRPAADRALGPR